MRLKLLMAVLLTGAMGDRPPPPPSQVTTPSIILRGGVTPTPAPQEAQAEALTILAAADVAPEDFLWQARPLVVFADTPADRSFMQQIDLLKARPTSLLMRDVVVIADTDPAGQSEWRRMLRPEGFSLVLIDKDGQVKTRKPLPWDVREITRLIDKFPSRLQEIGRAALP